MLKLSDIEKGKFIESLKRGDKQSEIALRFNLSTKTVYRAKKRLFKTGTLDCKISSGRPKKWSKRDARLLKRNVMISKHGTVAHSKSYMNLNVSYSTAIRMMKSTGFKAFKKIKKPSINKRVARLRLAYAKEHKDWTIEKWKKILWTDETKVNFQGSDGINYYWDDPKLKKKKNFIIERQLRKLRSLVVVE